MKKHEFSAKYCSYVGSNRFEEYNYLNTTQKRTKKFWTELSLLRQEPTFKMKQFDFTKQLCIINADVMANRTDPDQTAPVRSSLIWVYTVC